MSMVEHNMKCCRVDCLLMLFNPKPPLTLTSLIAFETPLLLSSIPLDTITPQLPLTVRLFSNFHLPKKIPNCAP